MSFSNLRFEKLVLPRYRTVNESTETEGGESCGNLSLHVQARRSHARHPASELHLPRRQIRDAAHERTTRL